MFGFQLISLHISSANNIVSSSLYQLPTYTTQGMLGVVNVVNFGWYKVVHNIMFNHLQGMILMLITIAFVVKTTPTDVNIEQKDINVQLQPLNTLP